MAGSSSELFFNLDDWHQLDHYTTVTVVLDENKNNGGTPVAVMLQQHNNLRTYLVREDIQIPDDGRPAIDIAQRSNELYPHSPGRDAPPGAQYNTLP